MKYKDIVVLASILGAILVCFGLGSYTSHLNSASLSVATISDMQDSHFIIGDLYDRNKLTALLPDGAEVTYITNQVNTVKIDYKVNGKSDYMYVNCEDIQYDDYGELCGWSQAEIDAALQDWSDNHNVPVKYSCITATKYGYNIVCESSNEINYILKYGPNKEYLTSECDIPTEIIDSIHAAYPSLQQPYTVIEYTDSHILFTKNGREYRVDNE